LLVDVLLDVSFCVWHAIIDDSEHGLWSLFSLVDLEECVFVSSSLFAHGTVVKVLSDTALVSDSDNWVDIAAITSDIVVHLLAA